MKPEPPSIFVNGTLDIMSINIVQEPVCGLGACVISVESRNKVLNEGNVVEGGSEDQLACCFSKILVELIIDICSAGAVTTLGVQRGD